MQQSYDEAVVQEAILQRENTPDLNWLKIRYTLPLPFPPSLVILLLIECGLNE